MCIFTGSILTGEFTLPAGNSELVSSTVLKIVGLGDGTGLKT
jgi:hypothetical protein